MFSLDYLSGIGFAMLSPEIFYHQNLRRKIMADENGTGNNFIWAITTIIIVAIIAGALYYSGFLGGTKKEKIDINVDVPATKSN